jgi:NAD(P)-dependent dehydrogenase (short-subunit alcohol dehydrogenase family)
MNNHLRDKTVVITGASRGIGAAAARYFADQGAVVVLAARDEAALETLVDQIKHRGGRAFTCATDVSVYEDVKKLGEFALDQTGQLDGWVNNAGLIEPVASLHESDPSAWAYVADVNYKGVYYGMREAIGAMLFLKSPGTIVNISSGAAYRPMEGWSHYCSTKAAVLSLTQCGHKEYASQGIRVLGLSPGTVDTDMQVAIRKSGVNPVSQLDPSVHIDPMWVAQALAFLFTSQADAYLGQDFSLKTDEGRALVGLPKV